MMSLHSINYTIMINISKKRRFPLLNKTADYWFIYKLSKKQLSNYLGVWFLGCNISDKNNNILRREYLTIVKVDNSTMLHLYNRRYNCLSITLMNVWNKPNIAGKEPIYNLKVQLHSIDDSSYGIWFNEISMSTYEEIKLAYMQHVENQHNNINGEALVNLGKLLDCSDIDYN